MIFWYSPILNQKLRKCFGDLVAQPKTPEELRHVLAAAYRHDAPITLRGGGTGNYGQSVPMDGGLIINRDEPHSGNRAWLCSSGGRGVDGRYQRCAERNRARAGDVPIDAGHCTIGGFVAGGSAGIGSVANGALRDPGNLISLTAMSVEEAPVERQFDGPDALHVHHAWGLNGVITDVTIRTVPTRNWHGCMATFDSYKGAYAAGCALAVAEDIACKLVSTVDARITAYFPRLSGHIRPDHHLLVSLVPAEDVPAFFALVEGMGGHVDLAMDDARRQELNLPHVFDFSYNHTTLQVLKADRSATYQQVGCPIPPDPEKVDALRPLLGDDVWMHHEFARLGGEVVTFDLPIIWFSTPERLAEINAIYETNGFPVYDAHTWRVEGGGLKNADYTHLAWKKRMDPKGLLNSPKSAAWDTVKHLSPEDIEARAKTLVSWK